jgi:choline dehydrogenase
VRLASPDPLKAPRIRFNYMSHEQDWREFRDAIRLTRDIMTQPALDRYRGRELAPGAQATSDVELDEFVRNHAETAYHPCGSCRMGTKDDAMAVVDAQGRVHGVEGLRVVDASIMPRIVTGNLNAPTIMMAEKIADHIRGRQALAPSQAAVYRVAPGSPTRLKG